MLNSAIPSHASQSVASTTTALSRANCDFSADELRAQIAELDHKQSLPSDRLENYRHFYGLDCLPETLTHDLFPVDTKDFRIAVQRFTPVDSKRCVILCHGYYDHVGLFAHVIHYLIQQKLTVIAFDHPGHGLSTGPRATIPSFDRYVESLNSVCQHVIEQGVELDRCHWVGQSMGGAIVMEYLHRNPDVAVGEVVLLAPLVRPYAWWLNRWVFLVAKHTITERPRVIAPNADNHEFYDLQIQDPLQAHVLPVEWVQAMVEWFVRFELYAESSLAPKIIQGYADRTVSWRHSVKVLSKRYPDADWLMLPHGQHHIANESEKLRKEIWAWLDENCTW